MIVFKRPPKSRAVKKKYTGALSESVGSVLKKHSEKIINDILEVYQTQVKSFEFKKKDPAKELLALIKFSDLNDTREAFERHLLKYNEENLVLTASLFRPYITPQQYSEMLSLVNVEALKYAKERAAYLVGKKWVNGVLVDNPNAQYVISEATREMLKENIYEAISEGWSPDRLKQALLDNYAFSSQRAEAIARTEVAFAEVEGNKTIWEKTGVVTHKVWLISEEPCDDCVENSKVGIIEYDDDFPNGDPPVHPNCTCDIAPAIIEQGEEL